MTSTLTTYCGGYEMGVENTTANEGKPERHRPLADESAAGYKVLMSTETPGISDADLEAYAQGRKELHEIVGLGPDNIAQLRGRAQFFLDGGHLERALIMLEMLEALDRTDMQPALWAVDVLLKLGSSDAADEKLDEMSLRFADCHDLKVSRAELYLQTGRPYDAAGLLKQVLDADSLGKTEAGRRAHTVYARGKAMFA